MRIIDPFALVLLGLMSFSLTLHAASRTSADYAFTTDIIDSAGQRAASADYAQEASLGAIAGLASSANEVVKHGFIGQLYELLGYGLLASDYYPAELGTTQLFPVRTADDGTNVVIPTAGFTFSVLSGPLASVSTTGLVTAGEVYQHSAAVVGATSPQFAGQLELPLNVQETVPDNFGSYAGDGLADAWQVQYFGLDNPLAAPGADASGSGQTNLLKYVAGLDPLDPNAVFRLRIEVVPGQPGQKRIVFGPVLADRLYSVKAKAALTDPAWQPLASEASDGLLPERTVTDLEASGGRKFYEVEITKP